MKNFDPDTELDYSPTDVLFGEPSFSQLRTLILSSISSGEQQHWTSTTHLFVRVSRQLSEEDFSGEHSLLRFVQTFRTAEKVYWRDREGKREIAGVGIAHSIQGSSEALSSILRRVQDATQHAPHNVRYFGGTRFYAASEPDDVWQHFLETAFLLPFIELERFGTDALTLHCTISVPYDTSLEAARETMFERFQALQPERFYADSESFAIQPNVFTNVLKRTNTPDKQAWSASIHAALEEFEAGTLEKVVLARRVRLECTEQPDATALLQERLRTAERATAVLLQFDHATQFFAATPELLYKRDGRLISTEAVAGTRKRGANTSDDAIIAEELLTSDKDRREHASVQRYIASALDELTESFSIGTVELLKLSTMQHLHAPFSGRLRANIDDAAILEQLHPTPAVGGTPRREAALFLQHTETFDRGWYAAPVGWLNAHAAEFVVAIRSALVQGASVYVFSGAGIVAGSEAEAEWREIELKIAPLLKLFQVNEEREAVDETLTKK